MSITHNLHVGQSLWFVPLHLHGQPRELKVREIRRKWAYLVYPPTGHKDYRIDMETLVSDDYGWIGIGRAYLSREACEAHMALRAVWERFHGLVRSCWTVPESVTIEHIHEAAKLLGIPMEEKQP